MRKTDRVGAIVKILSDAPNKTFTLKYFCELFDAAKSSLSEDVQAAGALLAELSLGRIITMPGAGGGIRFIPYISDERCAQLQAELVRRLSDVNRILGGGFLYTSDIMFDSQLMYQVALVFARVFQDSGANFVATIETKGIPAAAMTAHMLGLPMIVIRRESKVSEGSTMSINYFSGSSDRIQKMSVARRAVSPGGKAIIIDDFMRAGGSVSGIAEILSESGMSVVGTGVISSALEPAKKKVSNYTALLYLGKIEEDPKRVEIIPNSQIFSNTLLQNEIV